MPIQDGATALIISANGGNESVMALLLEAKADLNHANSVRHFSLST
jgi:ankyrin repeat protein